MSVIEAIQLVSYRENSLARTMSDATKISEDLMSRDNAAASEHRVELEAMLGQISRNEAMMSVIIGSWDRLFGLCILIFGGALSFGLHDNRREVLLVLPAAIATIILAAYALFEYVLARAGKNRYLEERLRALAPHAALYWESQIVGATIDKSLNYRVFQPVSYAFFLVASCYLSIDSALTVNNLHAWVWPTIALTALSCVVTLVAGRRAVLARARAYNRCLELGETNG
jgi:hypothetical protein